MITLANPKIETEINLTPETPFLLVSENPKQFYEFVSQMIKAFDGEESLFTFWSDDEKVTPSKFAEFVGNVFSVDFIEKRIVSLLYKRLLQEYNDGDFILMFNLLSARISEFIQTLIATVDFSVDYTEPDLESILKICSVKPAKEYESLLECLICYVNLLVELKNVSLFVFINLKSVLDDNDLSAFYHHCKLQKVSLLLIESSKIRNLINCETAVIITDDLCEIVENFITT